jgi:hypothetical protein
MPLKTLEEYNQQKQEEHKKSLTPRGNGIACPKCDREMRTEYSIILLSDPTQCHVYCECGFKGSIY